jgi:broad specificity phosphatase PhoE
VPYPGDADAVPATVRSQPGPNPAHPRDTRRVLLIVRHGQTPTNREGRLLGRADPPLSEVGEEQALRLARLLPTPDLVVSSPLRRARDTAAAFGRGVEVDERWIELDYGDFDGQHPGAVPAHVWARWRADPLFAPPGGESLDTLAQRVGLACEDLWERAAEATVVVVTHVSPIKAALAWALEVPIDISWRMFVEDASVSRIDAREGGKVVRWFNRGLDAAH